MSILDEAARLRRRKEEVDATVVSIALFGQPGSGKSSLINRLTGQRLAKEGVRTDTTNEAAKYDWNGLHLVDLPGYGTSKFPGDTYADRFGIRDFDLFLCVFDGKLHKDDTLLFRSLRDLGKVCLFVRNKRDAIWEEGVPIESLEAAIVEDVAHQVGSPQKVLFTSCRTNDGLRALEDAISAHLADAKLERWYRAAHAFSEEFLKKKREQCELDVVVAAGLAATNALNPVPGLDIAVDFSVLQGVFQRIRSNYGLTDAKLSWLESVVPNLGHVVKNVIEFSTKEGIPLLLKRYATRQTAKELTKWVPIVGQAIAATLGFTITFVAGRSYLNDCHTLATEILHRETR